MIEQILTQTQIIHLNHLSGSEMDKLIFYCGGNHAKVAIIKDNRPFEARDKMISDLKQHRRLEVLDDVFPNPRVSDIMKMSDALAGKNIDVVIGIGGGSTLDSAKGVSVILSNGGDLDDYLGNSPTRIIRERRVKLILIPTTAGTGSEVTRFGVFTARSGRKYTLNDAQLQADIAVLVSGYTYDLPASITATAFDALSHSLETIWNKTRHPLSDKVAVESAICIMDCIETAYGSDPDGRRRMLEGACMAGIGFNMTGTAVVHAISFILSEEWHIPHGVACAFTLEDAIKLNVKDEHTREKLVQIGKAVFGDGDDDALIEQFIRRIVELKMKFNLPTRFSDLDIVMNESCISGLFAKSLEDPKMGNNIVPVDLPTICNMIKNKI